MNVQVLGCSHHNTPLAVRERLAFDPAQTRSLLFDLRRDLPHVEAVVVSTCNRVEVYTGTEKGNLPTHQQVANALARCHGMEPTDVAGYLHERAGQEAVRHLFLVASSLDSMVVGEPQILSQVKQAYRLASRHSAAGPLTHAAFQTAMRVARRVACETSIHRHRLSIPSIAVADFAERVFEHFDDKRALVIGAGEMAEETLRYLRDQGAVDITVVNRSPARAAELAERWRGRSRPWEERFDALVEADLVVSTTAAPQLIVTVDDFRPLAASRNRWPLLILDLAVPRDFDPRIAEAPGVYLVEIDDLRQTAERNQRLRDQELPAAMRIIDQETRRFMADWNCRTIGPIVRRLREGWQGPKEAELDRLFKKLPALDQKQRAEIQCAFDRLVNKLLHSPMQSLRREAGAGVPAGLLEAVHKLFRLKQ